MIMRNFYWSRGSTDFFLPFEPNPPQVLVTPVNVRHKIQNIHDGTELTVRYYFHLPYTTLAYYLFFLDERYFVYINDYYLSVANHCQAA